MWRVVVSEEGGEETWKSRWGVAGKGMEDATEPKEEGDGKFLRYVRLS